jgi:hypothetical protein
MRLYRGLTKKYRPDGVGQGAQGMMSGTNFTDCPYAALQFGRGARGTTLILDVPDDATAVRDLGLRSVTKALWPLDGSGPGRFVVWGRFDDLLVAEIPAKDLRAQVRRKGVAAMPADAKSRILADFVERWIRQETEVWLRG